MLVCGAGPVIPAFPKQLGDSTARLEPRPLAQPAARAPTRVSEQLSVSFAGDPRAYAGARRRLQLGLPLTVVAISSSSAPAHFISRLNHAWPTMPLHTLIEVKLSDLNGMAGQLDCLPSEVLHNLGAKADLLLLEPLPFSGPSYWLDIVAIERVLRSVTMSMTTPSAMMLHGIGIIKQKLGRRTVPIHGAGVETGSDGQGCSTSLAAQAWLNSSEAALSLLAQFYGVPQVSLRWMLRTERWCNGTGLDARLAGHAASFLARGIERSSANGAANGAAAKGATRSAARRVAGGSVAGGTADGISRPEVQGVRQLLRERARNWEGCGGHDGLCLDWIPARTMLFRPPLSVNLTHGPTEASHAVQPPSEQELMVAAEADRRYIAPSAQGCPAVLPLSCSSALACVGGLHGHAVPGRFPAAEIAAEDADDPENEAHTAPDSDTGLHADPGAERLHAAPGVERPRAGPDAERADADRSEAAAQSASNAPRHALAVSAGETSDTPRGGPAVGTVGVASAENAWLSGRRGIAQLGPCQGFSDSERAVALNLMGHAHAGTCTAALPADEAMLARTRTNVGSLAAWRRVVRRLDAGEELSVVVLGVSRVRRSEYRGASSAWHIATVASKAL